MIRKPPPDCQASSLRSRFEELELLYRTAPLGPGVVDRELRLVRVNEQLAELTGWPMEEMIGRTTGEVVPEIAPKTESYYRRVLETGAEELAPHIFERANPNLARSLAERGCLVACNADDFSEWGGEAEVDRRGSPRPESSRRSGTRHAGILSIKSGPEPPLIYHRDS